MNELSIDIVGDWLGGKADADDATFASVVVRAGGVPLTEVQDTMAQSTRVAIRVPAIRIARWLVTEWWRLRWEARPETVTSSWRQAHSMAGLGAGIAWPALEIASDGELLQLSIVGERELLQLSIVGEREPDAAAIRYLRNVTVEVSARDWERAVDRFVESIDGRLSAVLPEDRELAELRDELRAERSDPASARRCRWQACAGYEPADAPVGWIEGVERLTAVVGEGAIDDVLGVTRGGTRAVAALDTLRRSSTTLDLSGVTGLSTSSGPGPSWQRGADAARRARTQLGIAEGPISDAKLGELIGQRLPLQGDATKDADLLGGYRARDSAGTTHVLLGTGRATKQRFHVARLMGMAAHLSRDDQVLALTGLKTASQKFARTFAQELLCPWAELDAYTDEHGMGESAIARAAESYGVSEMLITTTLVNRGKLERERLDAFAM